MNMLATTRSSSHFLQSYLHRHVIHHNYSNRFFSASSKEEREARLSTKYKANTKLPKHIGHLANIHTAELVYIPQYAQQLNPTLYASHTTNTDNESKVCIYQYKKKFIDKNKWEIKELLQFGLFSAVALGYPALLMLSLYRNPQRIPMTGNLTHEGIFYWTQSALMAFLVGGFLVFLRYQTGSWITMIKKKIYGSTSCISRINIIEPNILNVEYIQNTLFRQKHLSHNIQLSETNPESNQCFYLKPTVNPITESPDVEVVMDVPDKNGNIVAMHLPMDGTVMNWESFITFIKEIPNPTGKFKPVQLDKDGYIAVCKYKDLLNAPRTTLHIYSHGIPPYKRKNAFLFVPNLNKDELFVMYDHCKSRNESLVHKAAFYENKGETYLHCGSCHQAKNKVLKPLRSCVDWKLDDPSNEDEATLLVKIDGSSVKNPLEFTDSHGRCPLETLIGFYCTNSLRLAYPKKPENIDDIFVCGEIQQYDDWKDENSPSIASLKTT